MLTPQPLWGGGQQSNGSVVLWNWAAYQKRPSCGWRAVSSKSHFLCFQFIYAYQWPINQLVPTETDERGTNTSGNATLMLSVVLIHGDLELTRHAWKSFSFLLSNKKVFNSLIFEQHTTWNRDLNLLPTYIQTCLQFNKFPREDTTQGQEERCQHLQKDSAKKLSS